MSKPSTKRSETGAAVVQEPRKQPRREDFTYERLPADHIRILQVTADIESTGCRSFHCQLQTHHIKSLPHFIALSYAWAPAGGESRSMPCNGQHIRISKHLWDFFESISPLDCQCSFAVWIDAICIDQENDIEKNTQVTHMGSVYGLASQVIVWLGFIEAVNMHRSQIQHLAHRFEKAPEDDWKAMHNHSQYPADGSPVITAICSIMKSSWFSRLWVVQEVFLGREVQVLCGRCLLSWHGLRGLFGWGSRPNTNILGPMGQNIYFDQNGRNISLCMETYRRTFAESTRWTNFAGFPHLLDFRPQKASKPIDKVFGILFLLPEHIRRDIVVDYSQEDVVWRPYTILARGLVQGINGLHILFMALGKRTTDQLPSWCPDWNVHSEGLIPSLATKGPYSSLPRKHPTIRFGDDIRLLHLHGFAVDQVKRTIPGMPSDTYEYWLPNWSKWEAYALQSLKSWSGSCQTPEILLQRHLSNLLLGRWNVEDNDRWLIVDRDWDAITESYWPEIYHCYEELISGLRDDLYQGPRNLSTKAYNFWSSSCELERSYFMTQRGRMGRCYGEDKPGDVVVMLDSARTPFILRYEEGSNVATLIGEAFVDGCMFADKIPVAERGPDQWFTIG